MNVQQSDIIENLIRQLINQNGIKNQKQTKVSPTKVNKEGSNAQVQSLDVSDYLQLLAHQKKHISTARWNKLKYINQNSLFEQQDYKYFFAVACQAHFRRLQHPGYYKQLLEVKHTYPASFFIPIEKDVPRTFPPGHPFSESLRNVLIAYAIRNSSLVYCQGMNYIVAYLLINQVSAEQTFWIMACLIQNCLPDDYFKDLTTISIVACMFEDILDELTPEFKFVLEEAGMDATVLLVPWFVCLFSKGFINSVSAYLINYLMLESRQYRGGFILLKIAIAIIVAVFEREDELPFSKDFKTLKDEIQLYVFQISLEEIKNSLERINLNYAIYIQLQDYYRQEKLQTRALMLKTRERKIPLPSCDKQFPICFHRIEIEKKLGALQNALILKNGFSIKQQIVDNYLDEEKEEEETVDICYSNFDQCQVGRLGHICHLNEQQSHLKVDLRAHKYERDVTHRIELIDDEEEQVQHELQLSTYEERFKEVTEFFVIDDNYQEDDGNLQDQKCEQELQKQFNQFSVEKEGVIQQIQQTDKPAKIINNKQIEIKQKGIRTYLQNAFNRVTSAISDLQKLRHERRSRTSIDPPYLSNEEEGSKKNEDPKLG